jgi:hypothetical protein
MPENEIGPTPPRLARKRGAAVSTLLLLSAAAGGCDPWQPTIEVTQPAYNQVPPIPAPPPLYVQSLPPGPQYPYPVPVGPGGVPLPPPGAQYPYPVPVGPGGVPFPPPVVPVPVPQVGVPVPLPPTQAVGLPGVNAPVFDPALNVGQCHQIQAWGPFVLPRVFKGSLPSDLAPIGGSVQSGVYILVEARAYGPDAGRIQAPPLRSAKRITGDVMEEWFEVSGGSPSVYTDRFVTGKKDWNWSTQCPLQQSGARGIHRYSAQGDVLVFYKVDPAVPNLEQVFFYRRAF